jgi:oligopeptide transport system substrate-binding protein
LRSLLLTFIFAVALAGCGQGSDLKTLWNSPYSATSDDQNVLYSAFVERPKHLDPARAYSEDELTFLGQVYEAPLQYHYLKRPYTLIPNTLESMPSIKYLDAKGNILPANAPTSGISESIYELRLKPNLQFAPHPAFALNEQGLPHYFPVIPDELKKTFNPNDFPKQGTREVTADDYIYQIKRLAHPRIHSPIFGMMADKIVGLADLGKTLQDYQRNQAANVWIDLDLFPLHGVEKVDRYTWRIRIKGKYPQFSYWLAMPFFTALPREADRFFAQPGMSERNLILDNWPVGTGPFFISENDPNRRIVLQRNPKFRDERYPCEGEPEDQAVGLLVDCGKPLPLLEKAIFSREKESIPYWNKFLQGYYDASGISSDSFDQAVRVSVDGDVGLSDEMQLRNIRLLTSVKASTFYMGFNLLDSVVGGYSESNAKLRQAISIAIDQEEYISIFMNGRGVAAQSPLPPGIFGHKSGVAHQNPFVYEGNTRKAVAVAKKLLAEAGYPNGRHHKTGEPLILNLDTTSSGMGEKSRLDWLTRQFAKINIQLVVRSTDFNRFQEKLLKGAIQLFYLGWNADYPDPENFFFLFNGQEGRVKHGGENSANYHNPAFDRLFNEMKAMDNSPKRQAIIDQMTALLQHDAPWVFGLHPQSYTLGHAWLKNRKPNDVGNNILKYQRIDGSARTIARQQWNQPILWPFALISVAILAGISFVRTRRQKREK